MIIPNQNYLEEGDVLQPLLLNVVLEHVIGMVQEKPGWTESERQTHGG